MSQKGASEQGLQSSRSVWLQDLTSQDVVHYLENHETVLVPIGSTETHGPHLPLGVDGYEAIDYAEEIAQRTGALVTPPIWFGDNHWHMHGKGTITLRPETVVSVLTDVYTSVLRQGFRFVLTVNGHRLGNLPAISIASRMVREAHSGSVLACLDPLMLGRSQSAIREGAGWGVHGDELETSHMLFRHPELVHPEAFTPAHGTFLDSEYVSNDHLAGDDSITVYIGSEDQQQMAPAGHLGNPMLATAEKGVQVFEAVVQAGARFVQDVERWRAKGGKHVGGVGANALRLSMLERKRARPADKPS